MAQEPGSVPFDFSKRLSSSSPSTPPDEDLHPPSDSPVSVIQTERPRNVNAYQAAAILYGDWGTSKAYVIGLAFALAGHSSIWLVLGVCLLNILVGLNYIIICKYYPSGGGVYASVRHRSEVLALLGGFFLICDYIITASLSSISAFYYLGSAYPPFWAISLIGIIGFLNYFGPRHTGNLAFLITTSSIVVILGIAGLSFFYLGDAITAIEPLKGSVQHNWVDFVGIIVALSGVEAIANMTGVMKLNPGSTTKKPLVTKTSTPAIISVMMEVSIFTILFSLIINAIPNLIIHDGQVDAPGYPNVRDSMLRYIGEYFGSQLISPEFGKMFGMIISVVIGVLLLSAVNTVIVALNSLLFVMSRDGQLPSVFQKMNKYGVPKIPLLLSTIAPIVVLIFVHDMEPLAYLYAIGFVGAIAVNLGSTSTDKTLPLQAHERFFMFATCLIMLFIEITLFIEKPEARTFVITVVAFGLLMRAFVMEQSGKRARTKRQKDLLAISQLAKQIVQPSTVMEHIQSEKMILSEPIPVKYNPFDVDHIHKGAMLCATTHVSKSLEYAMQECANTKQKLFILFIRERKVIVQQDLFEHWVEDEQACKIFDYALDYLKGPNFVFLYDTSDSPALNIVEHAKELKVSSVILGMARKSRILQVIRGNVVLDVYNRLPVDIDLIIVS